MFYGYKLPQGFKLVGAYYELDPTPLLIQMMTRTRGFTHVHKGSYIDYPLPLILRANGVTMSTMSLTALRTRCPLVWEGTLNSHSPVKDHILICPGSYTFDPSTSPPLASRLRISPARLAGVPRPVPFTMVMCTSHPEGQCQYEYLPCPVLTPIYEFWARSERSHLAFTPEDSILLFCQRQQDFMIDFYGHPVTCPYSLSAARMSHYAHYLSLAPVRAWFPVQCLLQSE
jgi:hypothetical protein